MKTKSIRIKCECGCNSFIGLYSLGDGDIDIDTWEKGKTTNKKNWSGVYLRKENVEKIKKFLRGDEIVNRNIRLK